MTGRFHAGKISTGAIPESAKNASTVFHTLSTGIPAMHVASPSGQSGLECPHGLQGKDVKRVTSRDRLGCQSSATTVRHF